MTHEQRIYALDSLIAILAVALIALGVDARRQNDRAAVEGAPIESQKVVLDHPVTTSFDALVVRSSGGFAPMTITIKAGQTVRFINESKKAMWVAASSTAVRHGYPGTSSCGESAFDSCGAIEPGSFWDFTFKERGTWLYRDNLERTVIGTIVVQ